MNQTSGDYTIDTCFALLAVPRNACRNTVCSSHSSLRIGFCARSIVLQTDSADFREIPASRQIERRSASDLTMETFKHDFSSPGIPLIITGSQHCSFSHVRLCCKSQLMATANVGNFVEYLASAPSACHHSLNVSNSCRLSCGTASIFLTWELRTLFGSGRQQGAKVQCRRSERLGGSKEVATTDVVVPRAWSS